MSSKPEVKCYGNVLFLGVARLAGQAIIIASHVYHSIIDLDGVRKALEQPNMTLVPGKHYSFDSGQQTWHLTSGNLWNIPRVFFGQLTGYHCVPR